MSHTCGLKYVRRFPYQQLSGTSSKFSFITKGKSLTYTNEDFDRIIAVDVASPAQLGDLDFLAERVDLIIDHHAMNNRFSAYYEFIMCR